MFFLQQFFPDPSGLSVAREVVGKCLVALAVGTAAEGCLCTGGDSRQSRSAGTGLSKDRAVKTSGSSWFQLPTHEILQQTNKHQDPTVPTVAEQTVEVGPALESKWRKSRAGKWEPEFGRKGAWPVW